MNRQAQAGRPAPSELAWAGPEALAGLTSSEQIGKEKKSFAASLERS